MNISTLIYHLRLSFKTMITLGLASDPERLALEKCIMKMRPGEETRIEIGKIDPSGGRGSRKEVLIKLKHFSGCQVYMKLPNHSIFNLSYQNGPMIIRL